MKSAYEDVTRWVRFHSGMVWRELQLCNQGWVEPNASIFMRGAKPAPEAPEELLFLNEEVTSVIWLMNVEHDTLMGRIHELFGARELPALPEEIAVIFDPKRGPRASLTLARNSIAARMALLMAHEQNVDAHTRLVMRKHTTILRHLILPTLDTVLVCATNEVMAMLPADETEGEAAGGFNESDLIAQYKGLLPGGPRPHPDNFLKVALLEHA